MFFMLKIDSHGNQLEDCSLCGNGFIDISAGEECDDGGRCDNFDICTIGEDLCLDGSDCHPVSKL